MKIKTRVKAGIMENQHNQTAARSLKIRKNSKASVAGDTIEQHNQTKARALKIKTGIKAGPPATPIIRD